MITQKCLFTAKGNHFFCKKNTFLCLLYNLFKYILMKFDKPVMLTTYVSKLKSNDNGHHSDERPKYCPEHLYTNYDFLAEFT